jgi:hypothetical protein
MAIGRFCMNDDEGEYCGDFYLPVIQQYDVDNVSTRLEMLRKHNIITCQNVTQI